ncbi:Indole-3-acetic acid-induced protein ARG7 [Dendrobium catenatum]|uniref:Indole-3-acetic acid-induced protein ARG7 n=1 Tax=Dendrobium catenatum TaxID=906689 RepID=A0A2I0VM60_9ASPA|nr:Indole-3-acetic acid-induced protein ARG7 [Dendrobium catenatum]
MVSSKRIMEMAKKCRKVASFGKRSLLSTTNDREIASKGHIFVYSVDGQRFMIPLTHLRESIFRELFRMSEDEFGLQSDGPIVLPCDAPTMEYILSFLCRRN